MIDCYELDQMFTVWDFYHRSRAHIADVLSRNKVPIIVGGTPFYLRSLVQGVIEAPKKDYKLFNEIYHQLVHENNWNKK
jgi:tRNA dimethylallyltransferase